MNSETKLKQLEILLSVSALINSSLDPSEIRSKTVEAIVKLLNAEEGSLLLLDKETGELFFDVATGEKSDQLKQIRLKKGEGIAGWVTENGKPVIVNDVIHDPRFSKQTDKKTGFGQNCHLRPYPCERQGNRSSSGHKQEIWSFFRRRY